MREIKENFNDLVKFNSNVNELRRILEIDYANFKSLN